MTGVDVVTEAAVVTAAEDVVTAATVMRVQQA